MISAPLIIRSFQQTQLIYSTCDESDGHTGQAHTVVVLSCDCDSVVLSTLQVGESTCGVCVGADGAVP